MSKSFWEECYSGDHRQHGSPEDFRRHFCQRCGNVECLDSAGGKSPWLHRITTQVERLLNNPNLADPDDPRFKHLQSLDFPSMLREAMALEVSSRKGDWEIPTQEDALQLAAEIAGAAPEGFQEATEEGPSIKVLWEGDTHGKGGKYKIVLAEFEGQATWSCTCPAFQFQRVGPDGCKHIQEARILYESQEEIEDEPVDDPVADPDVQPEHADPEAWHQMRERNLVPNRVNTRIPSEGVMTDGSEPLPPPPPVDPWAVVKKDTTQVVPVGGTVTMGGKKP